MKYTRTYTKLFKVTRVKSTEESFQKTIEYIEKNQGDISEIVDAYLNRQDNEIERALRLSTTRDEEEREPNNVFNSSILTQLPQVHLVQAAYVTAPSPSSVHKKMSGSLRPSPGDH